MKATAFFMIIWMSLVSVFTGTLEAMHYNKEAKCCMQSSMEKPCKSNRNDKAMGICLTKLCCNVHEFTINKTVQIVPPIPIEIKNCSVNWGAESTMGFSFPFWQPPKVVLI